MANEIEDLEEEDPRAARIVRKMRLLVGISTAIMGLGFLLVMSVIVWRLVKADDAPRPLAHSGEMRGVLPIEEGQRITATSSDGSQLFVTVESENGAQAILVFDTASLTYRGRIDTPARVSP